jgi:hypothetical protein
MAKRCITGKDNGGKEIILAGDIIEVTNGLKTVSKGSVEVHGNKDSTRGIWS